MLGLGIANSLSIGGSGAPFSPLGIGADLWLRSDRGVTAGGSVPDPDGVIDSWNDPFNSLDFTQSSEPAKSLYKLNAFGAFPGLLFDGSDDFMQLGSAPFTDYPSTVFIVASCGDVANGNVLFTVYDDSSTGARVWAAFRGNSSDLLGIGAQQNGGSTNYASTSTAYTADQAHILTGEFITATSRKCYIDGGSVGSSATSRTMSGYDKTDIGRFGDAISPSNYFDGMIAEIVVFKRLLSAAELLLMHTYLAARYGITLL